jgi:hypothetical protein
VSLDISRSEGVTFYLYRSSCHRAGISSILRTVLLGGLPTRDYTLDKTTLLLWTAVEIAVTIVYIGVPGIRPLMRALKNQASDTHSGDAEKQASGGSGSSTIREAKAAYYRRTEVDDMFPILDFRNTSTVTVIGAGPYVRHHDKEMLGSHQRIQVVDDVTVEVISKDDERP